VPERVQQLRIVEEEQEEQRILNLIWTTPVGEGENIMVSLTTTKTVLFELCGEMKH